MRKLLTKFISILLTLNLLLQPLAPTLVYAAQSTGDSLGPASEEPPPSEPEPTCTTSTFVGECGFSGDNWCRIGQSCTATSPSISVSCPSTEKIRNIGTYCTFPDGRKSFSGRSECVSDISCPQGCTTKKIADCVRRECDPGIQKMVCIDQWEEDNCAVVDKPGVATDQRCGILPGQGATAPTGLETCFRQECDINTNQMVCIDKWNICEPEGCTETEKPGRLFGQSCVTSAPAAITQPADTPAEPAPIITYPGEPSCSLSAIPQTIQVGGEITWYINADPAGISANWIGPDLSQPSKVEGYPEGTLPNWSRPFTYNPPQPASYTRQAVINYSSAPACTTNPITITINSPFAGAAPVEPDINLDFQGITLPDIITNESQLLAAINAEAAITTGETVPAEPSAPREDELILEQPAPTGPRGKVIIDAGSQDRALQEQEGLSVQYSKRLARFQTEARESNEGSQGNPAEAISSAANNVGNVGVGAAQAIGGVTQRVGSFLGSLAGTNQEEQQKLLAQKTLEADDTLKILNDPNNTEEEKNLVRQYYRQKFNLTSDTSDQQIISAIGDQVKTTGIKIETDPSGNYQISLEEACILDPLSSACLAGDASSIQGGPPSDLLKTAEDVADFVTNGGLDVLRKGAETRALKSEVRELRKQAGIEERAEQSKEVYKQARGGFVFEDANAPLLFRELELDKKSVADNLLSEEQRSKRGLYEEKLKELAQKEREGGTALIVWAALGLEGGKVTQFAAEKVVVPLGKNVVLPVVRKITDPIGEAVGKAWDATGGRIFGGAGKEIAQEAARLNQIRVNVERQLVEGLAENPNAYPDEFIRNTLITEGKYTDEEAEAALERIKRKAEEIRSPQTPVEEAVPEAAPVQVFPEFTRAQSLDELFQILREAKEIRVGEKIYAADQLELIIIRLQNAKDIQQINALLKQLPNVGELRTTAHRLLIQEAGRQPAQAAQVTAEQIVEQAVPQGGNIFDQARERAGKLVDDIVSAVGKRGKVVGETISAEEVELARKSVDNHPLLGKQIGGGRLGVTYQKGEVVTKIFRGNPTKDDLNQMEILKKAGGQGGLPRFLGEVVDEQGNLVGFKQEFISGVSFYDFLGGGGKLTVDEAMQAIEALKTLHKITSQPHGDLAGVTTRTLHNLLIQTVQQADGSTRHIVRFVDYGGVPGGLDYQANNSLKLIMQDEVEILITTFFSPFNVGQRYAGLKNVNVVDIPLDESYQIYQRLRREVSEESSKEGGKALAKIQNAVRGGWDDTVGRLFKREPEIPLQPSYVGSVQLTPETIDETVNILAESFRNTPGASKESLISWVAAYYDGALSPEQLDEIATKALRTLVEKTAQAPRLLQPDGAIKQGIRSQNQDRIAIGNVSSGGFAGVFDGNNTLGHHVAEYASQNLASRYQGYLDQGWSKAEALKKAIYDIDQAVVSRWGKAGGSTAAVVHVEGRDLLVGNVGDSRVILSDKGKAKQLTQDHNMANLEEVRRLGLEGSPQTGMANRITRVLGGGLESFGPDVEQWTLGSQAEFIVIGSDGLTGVMDNQSIVNFVRERLGRIDPQQISQELVNLAIQRGSGDNVTAIIFPLKPLAGGISYLKINNPRLTSVKLARAGFSLIRTAQAAETNPPFELFGLLDQNIYQLWVKQNEIKKTLLRRGKVDSTYIKTVASGDVLKPQLKRTTAGYELTTGSTGFLEGNIPSGRYAVAVAPLVGFDIKAPSVVEIKEATSIVIPVAIKKGTGKVEKTTTPTGWQWLLNKLFGTVFAQEKKESQVQLVVFSDTNNNGKIDKDEQVLPWAGLKVELKKVNQDRTLSLIPGWNLVALEVLPAKPLNASTLLQEIAKQGGYATTVSVLENGAWKSFVVRGDKTYSGDDFPITPGKAYFVKALKSSVLVYQGQELVAPIKLNLASGWNGVGVPYSEKPYQAADFIDTLNTKGGGADTASRWESGLWDTFVKLQDQRYGENFMIDQGRGYLLKVAKGLEFSP